MQEEYQGFRRCDVCQRKDSHGIFQVGDQAWLCERCYRNRERDKVAAYVDWSTRETIDSLTESTHYFAELYRKRASDYRTFELVCRITGSKGVVCHVLDMVRDTVDPLGMQWTRYHRYYQLFNRRYLERGNMRYERASMFPGMWQTVHKKVVDQAVYDSLSEQFKDNVCIVVVMQNKTVWYINPRLLKKFAYEYETYNPNEDVQGYSVPIIKESIISATDPFFPGGLD